MWTCQCTCAHIGGSVVISFRCKKKEKEAYDAEEWNIRPCKASGFSWESFFFFFFLLASEGGVCSALALRVHSLSTPQVSTHYLKIGGRKVQNWQSGNGWGAAAKNRHTERCDPSEQRSQPTRLFRLVWPQAEKGTSRNLTSDRSLALKHQPVVFHSISKDSNHLMATCEPLKRPCRCRFSVAEGISVTLALQQFQSLLLTPPNNPSEDSSFMSSSSSIPNQCRHCSHSSHPLALISNPDSAKTCYSLCFVCVFACLFVFPRKYF